MTSFRITATALLAAPLVGACGSGGPPSGPEAGTLVMAVLEGNNQQAAPSSQLPVSPAVRVTRDGAPVGAMQVTFTITSGGGSGGGQTVTDSDGIARAPQWTLGPELGEQRMVASLGAQAGSTVLFSAYATLPVLAVLEGHPAKRTFSSRQYSTNQIYVRMVDADGEPVANAEVLWHASGPARVSSAEGFTDAQGYARLGLLTFDGSAIVVVEARSHKILTAPASIHWTFEAQ